VTLLVTNANEILTDKGIHGKIGAVGIGFGTGRHTANVHNHTRKITTLKLTKDAITGDHLH